MNVAFDFTTVRIDAAARFVEIGAEVDGNSGTIDLPFHLLEHVMGVPVDEATSKQIEEAAVFLMHAVTAERTGTDPLSLH